MTFFDFQIICRALEGFRDLIFSLLFGKKKPAITLKDPTIKYPLRLIDKEVSNVRKRYSAVHLNSANHYPTVTLSLPPVIIIIIIIIVDHNKRDGGIYS